MNDEWCIVDGEKFCKLLPFVGAQETRYFLHGVHVEPDPRGGVFLVATDGIVMGIYRDPTGQCSGKMIVRNHKSLFRELTPVFDEWGDVQDDVPAVTGRATTIACKGGIVGKFVATGEAALRLSDIDMSKADRLLPEGHIAAEFPDWRKVIPFEMGGGVTPDKLESFAKKFDDVDLLNTGIYSIRPELLSRFLSVSDKLVIFSGETRAHPYVVRASSDEAFFGLIMPYADRFDERIPDWLLPSDTSNVTPIAPSGT